MVPDQTPLPPRLVARLHGRMPGATLIVIGGLHGNEPSGVAAMGHVAETLERARTPLHGDVTMLAGSVAALLGRLIRDRQLDLCHVGLQVTGDVVLARVGARRSGEGQTRQVVIPARRE